MSEWLPGTYEPKGLPVVNMFTNPSFETAGADVTVFENLFTNPDFVAGSGTVEVRRNLVDNPSFEVGTTGWSSYGATTLGRSTSRATAGTASLTVTSTAASTGGAQATNLPATAGLIYTASADALAVSGTAQTRARLSWYNGSTFLAATEGTPVTLSPTAWTRISVSGAAPATATRVDVVLYTPSPTATEVRAFDAVLLEVSTTAGLYFDGAGSPDPDLAASWTGAPNASPSILTGVPVAGATTGACFAIRSTKFGGSMRLIPTSPTITDSYANVSIPESAWAAGTFMGTAHLEAPLTGSLSARSRRLVVFTPEQLASSPSPNEAGSHPQRVQFSGLTSVYQARYYHGGTAGSGDVYWTKGALLAGAYSGPAFSPSNSYPDTDFTTAWSGTPNASTTKVTAKRAAGTNVGWRSSKWAASRTRSLYVPAGSVQEFTLTDQTLIVTPRSGSQTVLVNDAPTTAGVEFRFQGTAIVGLGEGWWDNLAIIQGAYDGPNFDGSTPDTDQWAHAWQGTPDASPSTRQEMEAVMATIYGTLTDFGLQTLTPYKPVLKFTPSGPGVKGRKVFSGRPVEVPVASDGSFSVLLEPTDGVTPKVWYTVSIEYLNDGGQYTSLDILGYRLFVPAPGGAIGDLPGAPLSADTVLVGLTPPPPGYRGWWLYSPAEGEEMPADETGIGDLRMVA